MTISATSRFFILLCCCIAVQFSFAQTYLHPTAGLQSTFAGNCEVNLCSGVYTDDGGTGGNYANNVNNIYRTFCPSAPGQCIRLTFTQFSLEAPDFFGDCYDYLTIGSGPTQNSPVVWQGCGTTLPPAITSTDPSGCLTMRFVSDAVINAAGWRANITCVPCAGGGPSALLSNDCANAQYVCDNLQPLNANSQGPGLVSDACVSGCAISENYSNWFILNVTAVGTMGFTISPTPTIADYDFTLYGPVAGGCANLGAPIRCSYAANTGATGMRAISSDPSEDVNGDGWVSQANMAVGTYYLLINQWAYEPSSTFRLDFNGTSSIGLPSLNISSNSPVCDNLPLQLTGPLVQGATYSWTGPSGWTSNQRSPTRNPPVAGTYNFSYTVNGCTSPPISLNVVINPAPTAAISPTATSICPGQNITLTANGGASYAWSNSANTQSITVSPAATTNYTVTVTAVGGCTATATQTVTVNSNLAVVINPSAPAICNGANTTLTATGGTSYTWSNSANTPGITVNPTTTTTYTVTATNGASCTGTASATVTVNANPVASVLPATISICNGASTTLTASGGTSYAWSNSANTASITVNPITTTTYTATVTNANGCTATASGTVTVNALPVATINPATTSICSGQTLTLTAGGGTSYAWSTSENTAGITVSPTINTTYTVTVTNAAGCTATATRTITVNASPIALINPAAVSICTGISTTLSASGGTSYAWSNAANTPGTSVAPTATTTYTVTVSNISGCTATATSTVTVNALPIATISPATASICSGASATLTANGGITYAWNNSENTQSITVSTSGNYVVTVTDANNCTASASRTVTVNSNPAATILPLNVTLCTGASATLTASGGTSYLWSTTENTPGISITPAATTTYSVTVTDANNCTATASRTVNVNALPVVAVSPASVSICNGANSTLTASGANSYVWSTTEVSPTITVNPATTTTYTVTATDVNSCSATASATVTVNALPITTISPSAVSICAGENTTLTGSGGGSFTWSTTENTTSIIVAPITTTTYSVTITDASGCTASASATVTVNQNPVAAISPAAIAICEGASATLTASGGVSYVWSNSAITQDITIAPTTATIYSVTVTDGSNCTATDTRNVTVNTNPVVAISPASAAICDGGNATLTASGGATYLWSNSAITQSITVNPASTTSYSVTATDVNSCSATASATVTVNTLPNATISPATASICTGSSATLTANGGTTYLWSTTEITLSITVSPLATTTYSVTVTDANSCSVVVTRDVNVGASLVVNISPAVVAICEGASTTLTASGGTSFVWSTTEITSSIIVSPLAATTYSVTASDVSGCTGTASRDVTVNTNPTAVITPATVLICAGENATLNATGGINYSWSTTEITPVITVAPITTSTYDVTVTDINGCTASTSRDVTVNALPIAAITPASSAICEGANTTLTASGGVSYAWSNGLGTTQTVPVSPAATTSYFVTVTDVNNCEASTSEIITVNTLPLASIISTPSTICEGGSSSLFATGGTSYAWSTTEITPDILVSPNTTSTYSVTVTDANNCSATTSSTVQVNANPLVAISPASSSICGGQNVPLSATGATTYLWSTSEAGTTITVSPFATTNYSVTGTDANNCTGTGSSTVDVLQSVTITPIADDVSCNGESDGAVNITVNGGQLPYSYLWSNGAVTQNISGVPANNYSVTVTDAINCGATAGAIVAEPNAIAITETIADISCLGEADGAIDITLNGGATPYAYAWSDGDLNEDRINLSSGNYSVEVMDANSCAVTADYFVREGDVIILNATETNPTCAFNGNDGTITVSGTGGTEPYTYAWSNGNGAGTNAAVAPGDYTVTVTDDNGCAETADFTLTYEYVFTADAGNGATITVGQSVTLGYTTAGNAGNIVSNIWSPAASLNCGACPEPDATPEVTTLYTITVLNEEGCPATDTIRVTVIEEGEVVAPNVFTPDGDGNNDDFQIYGNLETIKFFEAQIYNRWGEKIFESNDPTFKWNGIYRGNLLRPDVYIYQVRLNTLSNSQVRVKKGSVTLMR